MAARHTRVQEGATRRHLPYDWESHGWDTRWWRLNVKQNPAVPRVKGIRQGTQRVVAVLSERGAGDRCTLIGLTGPVVGADMCWHWNGGGPWIGGGGGGVP